ncbi:MAG: ATP-binding protein [Limnochordia bacterium]|nr:AAA family ATPase [Bacillota bacterium]
MSMFRRATKQQAKLRMAIIGPAGSGKTYTALKVATELVPDGRIAVIDTERGSASKYAGTNGFQFDVAELESFHPHNFIKGISEAEEAGYDVIIIDSLSHAWMGKDGTLELVDQAAKRMKTGNSYAAWKEGTKIQNQLVDAMLQSKLHVIATMRSKMEYVQEKDDKGKTVIRKVGLQPVQRDQLEFEFDVIAEMDQDNTLVVSKTRCPDLAGAVIDKPGKEIADILRAWLSDGAPVTEEEKQTTTQEAPVATDYEERLKRLFAIAKEQARAAGHPDPTLHARERWFAVTNTKTMEDVTTDALDRFEADLNTQELQMGEGQ